VLLSYECATVGHGLGGGMRSRPWRARAVEVHEPDTWLKALIC